MIVMWLFSHAITNIWHPKKITGNLWCFPFQIIKKKETFAVAISKIIFLWNANKFYIWIYLKKYNWIISIAVLDWYVEVMLQV